MSGSGSGGQTAGAAAMTVIDVRGLAKRFGPATVADGLSFAVGAGTVTGFLGPNGAGKTTTLRMLLGLVTPTSGQAAIWGKPYRELGGRRRRVGAVLEAPGLHPAAPSRITCGSAAPPPVPRDPGSARCWPRPGWASWPGTGPGTCRWESGSGWAWPGRCSASRRY
jgi:hypothetical protein